MRRDLPRNVSLTAGLGLSRLPLKHATGLVWATLSTLQISMLFHCSHCSDAQSPGVQTEMHVSMQLN